MEVPVWFSVLAWAEILVVTTFLIVEAARFAAMPWVMRTERGLHRISDDRYFSRFMMPTLGVFTCAAIAYGVNLWTDQDRTDAGQLAGVFLVVTWLALCLRYYAMDATGSYPRAVARARARRALARVAERLAAEADLSDAEGTMLRSRLRRIGRVGDRLVRRADSLSWRDALRTDRTWLKLVAALAAGLPLLTAAWGVTGSVLGGDPPTKTLSRLGLGLAFAGAVAAALLLRFHTYRRGLRTLGVELRAESDRLLECLPDFRPPTSGTAPASRFQALTTAVRTWVRTAKSSRRRRRGVRWPT